MKNDNPSTIETTSTASQRVLLVFSALLLACTGIWGCTSALVGAQRGADGRWLLWKHRDSGHPDNYVHSFAATDSTLAYVALFNASDTTAREAWIGFNETGFAVMNTASYNIPAPGKNHQDREGLIMTEALRKCRSLAEFYSLLTDHDKPLGVQANFGAFDACGHGAYFETDDINVAVFPLDSLSAVSLGVEWKHTTGATQHGLLSRAGVPPDGILTRTNYSITGHDRKLPGLSRHKAENHLIDSVIATNRPWASAGHVAAEDFIETLSRSFYLPEEKIDLLDGTAASQADNGDVIPRRSSCASVVIEGPLPGENPSETMIMWTAIGFPALSVVEPVSLDSVPTGLTPTTNAGHSPICDEVNALRDKTFSPASPKKTHKPAYTFNLRYLREAIPRQRAVSLTHYPPARNRRPKH